MLMDGLNLIDGSPVSNFSVEVGPDLPTSGMAVGELLYKTGDSSGFYVFVNSTWTHLQAMSSVLSVNGLTGEVVISDIAGNAATASALETARDISLSGDITGSATFDGSANISITATVDSSKTPYDISSFFNGTPTASEVVCRFLAPRTFTLPLNLTGSYANAGVSATALSTFTISIGGINVGSFQFGAGQSTATFTFSQERIVTAGTMVAITAPAAPDSTLKDITFTLAGSL